MTTHPPIEAIERLKEAAEKATQGSWEPCGSSVTSWDDGELLMEWFSNGSYANEANDRAFFLAANPAFILSLISSYGERGRRIAAQAETIGDLCAALHPFALEAMEWNVNTSSDVVPACGVSPTTTPAKFTVGDLRRAASAYAAAISKALPNTGEQSQ